MNILKRFINSESICAFYLTMFSLLSPITHTVDGISTLVLSIGLCCCFIGILLVSRYERQKKQYNFLLGSVFFIIILFLADISIRPNDEIASIFYSFIVYGALTMFFCVRVSDYTRFLKSYCFISFLCGLIMLIDPLQDYKWSNTYMEFGFVSMLPAFAASTVLYTVFKLKKYIIFMLLFFVELVIFANKGSIVTALILLIVGMFFFRNNNRFSIKQFVVLTIILILLFSLYLDILLFFFDIADRLGFDSYSLKTISLVVDNVSDNSVYDTRFDIWRHALTLYNENPIMGNGIGSFRARNEGYEHNVFIEILNSWGIIGIGVFIIVLFKAFSNILHETDKIKQSTEIVFCIIAFVPLLTSLTFWAYQPFWAFLALTLKKGELPKMAY